MCLTRHRGQGVLNMQVPSVAPLVLPAETVGLTAPHGLSVWDQSPIFSIAVPDYTGNLRDDHFFGGELRLRPLAR
jgi:hypothetical protein